MDTVTLLTVAVLVGWLATPWEHATRTTRRRSVGAPVVGALPRCAIRPTCRWFRQEGREACLRCPQVATELRNPSELELAVAG